MVVRLHGSSRSDIEKQTGEKWNQVVDPKPDALAATAEIVLGNVARKISTSASVKSHFEGSAPLTIGRLLARLGEG